MKTKQIKFKHRQLYKLLKHHEYKFVSLQDFRTLLNVSPAKYTRFNDLKKRVLNVFQADINENSDIRIEYKFKKNGKEIIAINFFITSQTQLELFQLEDHKIPASIMEIIPLEYMDSCVKTCQEILHHNGVEGLRFYITECNSNFQRGYYSEYLITIFNLGLYDDLLDAQKAATEAMRQKEIAKHRAELKTQEKAMLEHLNKVAYCKELLSQVDTLELDAYIFRQKLTSDEKEDIKAGNFNDLRLKYVESFLQNMIESL
jgi:uncharacterized protein YkuJ